MMDYVAKIQEYRSRLHNVDREIAVLESQKKELENQEKALKAQLEALGCKDQASLEAKLNDITSRMDGLIQKMETTFHEHSRQV